ncbi:hypothetical protein SAMN05880573_1104 [Chryseobacterium sp. RU33C]|nr:hypothetical protein SAMN05880573_1104 [Chryseobacterium sp. RU33C]
MLKSALNYSMAQRLLIHTLGKYNFLLWDRLKKGFLLY